MSSNTGVLSRWGILSGLIPVVFAFAQAPIPSAPQASVVTVSPAGGHYSEPGIALDPNRPNHVVVVYQGGAAVQGTSNAAYSVDGGKTFTRAHGTKPPDWKVAGDVSTTFDNKGNAYLCYLTFDKLGTSSYWAHNVGRNGIFVRRSRDGGKTWDAKAIAIKQFATSDAPGIQFEDEPRIFADVSRTSPYAGSLYAGWVEWQLTQSIMLFSRSTDEGQTWSEPIRISTHPGLPRDDNGSLGGFVAAIASDGTVYVAWDDGNTIAFTESHDGGKTFSESHAVVDVAPPYFGEVPGVSRVEGFPQLAINGQNGTLFLCWSDYRNGDIDVFVASSSDRGHTWSKPVRVNDDAQHNGKDQFYQWMAVDPVSGAVYVEFYDRRADPKNRNISMTLARSTDGGRTFKNYTWTEKAFDPSDAFLGDYTWMAAYKDRVYAAWTEAVPKEPAPKGSKQPPAHSRAETVILAGTADFSNVK